MEELRRKVADFVKMCDDKINEEKKYDKIISYLKERKMDLESLKRQKQGLTEFGRGQLILIYAIEQIISQKI